MAASGSSAGSGKGRREQHLYLLIESSAAAAGKPLESFCAGMADLLPSLRAAAKAKQLTLVVHALQYDDNSRWLDFDLRAGVPVDDLAWPASIDSGNQSHLGAALSRLAAHLLKKTPPGLAPILVLAVRSNPTDNLKAGIDSIMAVPAAQLATRLVVAFGKVDAEVCEAFSAGSTRDPMHRLEDLPDFVGTESAQGFDPSSEAAPAAAADEPANAQAAPLGDLIASIGTLSLRAQLLACVQLADLFHDEHARGFAGLARLALRYSASQGRIVIVQGSAAPHVTAASVSLPLEGDSVDNDRHALASVIFALLTRQPPFADGKFVGTRGLVPAAEARWSRLPTFLRQRLTAALDDAVWPKSEPADVWRADLLRAHDAVVVCPHCGAEAIYDKDACDPNGPVMGDCPACGKPIPMPPRLGLKRGAEVKLVCVGPGAKLYPVHVGDPAAYEFAKPLATVEPHPTEAGVFGLLNTSGRNWNTILADGREVVVAPGKRVVLKHGVRVDFGPAQGQVRVTATPGAAAKSQAVTPPRATPAAPATPEPPPARVVARPVEAAVPAISDAPIPPPADRVEQVGPAITATPAAEPLPAVSDTPTPPPPVQRVEPITFEPVTSETPTPPPPTRSRPPRAAPAFEPIPLEAEPTKAAPRAKGISDDEIARALAGKPKPAPAEVDTGLELDHSRDAAPEPLPVVADNVEPPAIDDTVPSAQEIGLLGDNEPLLAEPPAVASPEVERHGVELDLSPQPAASEPPVVQSAAAEDTLASPASVEPVVSAETTPSFAAEPIAAVVADAPPAASAAVVETRSPADTPPEPLPSITPLAETTAAAGTAAVAEATAPAIPEAATTPARANDSAIAAAATPADATPPAAELTQATPAAEMAAAVTETPPVVSAPAAVVDPPAKADAAAPPVDVTPAADAAEAHLFLVIESSASMAEGGRMQAVNAAIREAVPHLQATAAASAATTKVIVHALQFGAPVSWVSSSLRRGVLAGKFAWPDDVQPEGEALLGEALTQLADELSKLPDDARQPVIVLILDGPPDDNAGRGLSRLLREQWAQRAVRVVVPLTDQVDDDFRLSFQSYGQKTMSLSDLPSVAKFLAEEPVGATG